MAIIKLKFKKGRLYCKSNKVEFNDFSNKKSLKKILKDCGVGHYG
ncbi:MAG: hypothetical protein AABY22_23435 [Nanoarchaeota archaeon]